MIGTKTAGLVRRLWPTTAKEAAANVEPPPNLPQTTFHSSSGVSTMGGSAPGSSSNIVRQYTLNVTSTAAFSQPDRCAKCGFEHYPGHPCYAPSGASPDLSEPVFSLDEIHAAQDLITQLSNK
jgi:hypothetical protein